MIDVNESVHHNQSPRTIMKKHELLALFLGAATFLTLIYIWFAPLSKLAKREHDAVAAVIKAEGVANVLNPRTYPRVGGIILVEFDGPDTDRFFGYAEVLSDGSVKNGRATYVRPRLYRGPAQ